ncbi:ATP-binding protein [Sphingomonas jatrophae]|uniref:histidine kinase n=1 Tax=Sphingomonas jatrophae TaxID=1166337 RepID=A0A1I6LKS4_9SPHN|nr:ATP-binding protein [Sphingomonas jatrophae]SFS04049.1 two-component system, sensor histidine kinase RpfC [Sphingomonas jatrophae]
MSAAAAQGASLFKRLRGRPDSEHEMSFNRVAFALFALATTLIFGLNPASIPILIAFLVLSTIVFVQLLFDTSANVSRRTLMMFVDFGMILSFIALSGAASAGFWPLLLWTSLGNGFRFGRNFLFAATVISTAGFIFVVAVTPFWRANLPLSIGLTLGLVAIPLYAAQLIQKLSKATAAAEEASRAKSYFLASVSHELRTPLTAIIGLGEHLAATSRETDKRETAGTIVEAGRQLLTMITRLLDFSRFEANGAVLEIASFDLARLLGSVRALMEHQALDKGLKLNLHLEPDTPTALRGDEARLREVLVNLVGNALKFTDQGAITIIAGMEPGASRPMLRLVVADTGIGIAEEAQEHIFGSFRQADATIIDRYGGTGLGLAICRQIATLMGGQIGVDSRVGSGSRFWLTARVEIEEAAPEATAPARLLLYSDDPELALAIGRGVVRRETRDSIRPFYDRAAATVLLVDARHLAATRELSDTVDLSDTLGRGAVPILLADPGDPVPPPDEIERMFVSRLPRQPTADALDRAVSTALRLAGIAIEADAGEVAEVIRTPRRILVADDNAVNQRVFGMILDRAGHEVGFADDGEKALDLMRDEQFDAVLMDVNMPIMNGIETTKLYRFASVGQPRVPIIAVTADASQDNAERCLEAGMDACIAKPIDAEPLLDLIDSLVERTAAPAAVLPGYDPAGVVTPLTRAEAPAAEAIDWSALAELDELGGSDFVAELIGVYLKDADGLAAAVRAAVVAGDVVAFRTDAHALCSSAANVGATIVADLCRYLQRIGEAEFHERGAWQADRLDDALARARSVLEDWPQRTARRA